MAGLEVSGSSWKSALRPWVPPALVERYRRLRYGAMPQTAVAPLPEFSLPVWRLEDIFPGIETIEVEVAASEIGRMSHMVMPLAEVLTLAALARHLRPRTVFEFGTYVGASTVVLGRNTPGDSVIYTLDLDPEQRDTHEHGLGVGGIEPFVVGREYRGTEVEGKIQQLYANSRGFDAEAYTASIDLVIVDADHSYEFVRADSELAFRMIRPGGVIIWDDYVWDARFPECAGVTRYVNELSASTSCYRIEGTRFAVHVAGC